MKVTLKFVDGKAMEVEVDENDDVDGVKQAVRDKLGHAVDNQRLIWKGNQLDGGRTWGDYNLKDKSLEVTVVLRGGAAGWIRPFDQLWPLTTNVWSFCKELGTQNVWRMDSFFPTFEPNSLEAVYRGCVSQFVRIGCEGR